MPLVLKTRDDNPSDFEIVGVGVLKGGGVGGLPVAVAAARGHAALQVYDAVGQPTGAALVGSAQTAAARSWAEQYEGQIELVNLKDDQVAKLQAANTGVEDEYPDAATKAEQEAVVYATHVQGDPLAHGQASADAISEDEAAQQVAAAGEVQGQ